jgi:hypothetical protein
MMPTKKPYRFSDSTPRPALSSFEEEREKKA